MLRIMLSLALATGVSISAIYAADGQTGSNKNTNNNSKWNSKTLQQQFNLKDVNKDGKLTWKEFKGSETNANRLVKLEKMFKAMDTGHTGYVTWEQYKAYWQQTKANKKTARTPRTIPRRINHHEQYRDEQTNINKW